MYNPIVPFKTEKAEGVFYKAPENARDFKIEGIYLSYIKAQGFFKENLQGFVAGVRYYEILGFAKDLTNEQKEIITDSFESFKSYANGLLVYWDNPYSKPNVTQYNPFEDADFNSKFALWHETEKRIGNWLVILKH